jgi:hypothetical protein
MTLDLHFERDIHIRSGHSTTRGKLRLIRLRQIAANKWACEWSLDPISAGVIGKMHGDDPLDALIRCVYFLECYIRGLTEDGTIVWWQYEGDLCGFATAYPGRL